MWGWCITHSHTPINDQSSHPRCCRVQASPPTTTISQGGGSDEASMMPSDVQASEIVAICTGGVPPPEWFDVGRSRSICCCETSRKRLTPQRFGFPRRDNTACGLAVACTLHEARMRPANYIDPKPLPLCPVTLTPPPGVLGGVARADPTPRARFPAPCPRRGQHRGGAGGRCHAHSRPGASPPPPHTVWNPGGERWVSVGRCA